MRTLLVIACLPCACYLDTATRLSLSRPASSDISSSCLGPAIAAVPGIRVIHPYSTRRSGIFVELASGENTGSGYVEIVADTALAAPVVSVEYSWFGAVPELGERQAATRASRQILDVVRERCTPEVHTAISCSLVIGSRPAPCPVS